MAGLLTSTAACLQAEVNFFTSGAYTRPSFSSNWDTLNSPYSIGLTPVYQDVLNTYNIPASYPNGVPPGGALPGIDIKRMDAIEAIRLSLAEALTAGQWWEIYEDNFGGVYFTNLYDNGSPTKTVNLDVRLCVPSASLQNEVDMVIVRGYDPPPQIYARDFSEFPDVVPGRSGPVNPSSITGNEPVFTVDMSLLVDATGGCSSSTGEDLS